MSKAVPLLLDTHVWVRYQNGSEEIANAAKSAIELAALRGLVHISVISVWEIALLVRLRRLDLNTSVESWSREALSKPGVHLLAFSPEIAIASVDLPEPMHRDPADRILVASARVAGLTLVTRDRDILAFAKTSRLTCLQA